MDDEDKSRGKTDEKANDDDDYDSQDALEPSPPPRNVKAEESLRATERKVLSKKIVKRTAIEPPTSTSSKSQQRQALEPGTSGAEANLRSTERQVLSKKQVKPHSPRPSQQALEPRTPTRSSAEASLRSTEKQMMSKKQVQPKSMSADLPPQSPGPSQKHSATEPRSPTRAAEANLRSTEKRVLSKKQVTPKVTSAEPPTQSPTRPSQQQTPLEPQSPSRAAKANLRSTEKTVLSKRQAKPAVTAREPQVSTAARRTEASIARKVAANTPSSPGTVLQQIAPDMRARRQASPSPSSKGAARDTAGAQASPLTPLDRRILAKCSPRGGETATVPSPVGPDGESVSTKRLREMMGEGERQNNNTAGENISQSSATARAALAMGIPEPPLTSTAAYDPVPNSEEADYQHALAVSAEPPSAYTATKPESTNITTELESVSTAPEPRSAYNAGGNAEIQAFVAEPAPQLAVPVDKDEEEEEEIKFRKNLLIAGGCICIVAIIVVVAVVVAAGGDSSSSIVGFVPPPTPSPTLSPTTTNAALLISCLISFDGTDTDKVLNDRSSPQFQAAAWLADQDEYDGVSIGICDQRLLERYALASLYFATNGPNWEICNEKDPTCTREYF
eukprot:scaffold37822_cov168-Amphora_coffeaeformis.AAC.2